MAIYNRQRISYLIDLIWNTANVEQTFSTLEAVRQLGVLLVLRKQEPKKWSNIIDIQDPKELSKALSTELSQNFRFQGGHYFINSRIAEIIKSIETLFELLYASENRLPGTIEGYIFDAFLDKLALSRELSVVRTPQHVVKLMIAIADPKEDEWIYDPSCGTGDFLVHAGRYITINSIRKTNPDSIAVDEDGFEYVRNGNVSDIFEPMGSDANKTMIELAGLNLKLNNMPHYQLWGKDDISPIQLESRFDLVLCNPPFGLRYPDYAYYSKRGFTSSELIYLERSFDLLKHNGRAVVIVPEGILSNSGRQYVNMRKMILENHTLEAVFSLPAGTFVPYTTGRASILVLRNHTAEQESVWFCALENDGYSPDKNRRRMKGTPLVDALDMYRNRSKNISIRTDNNFFVPLSEIMENNWDISFNRYREFNNIVQQIREPQEILAELLAKEREIQNGLEELKCILN